MNLVELTNPDSSGIKHKGNSKNSDFCMRAGKCHAENRSLPRVNEDLKTEQTQQSRKKHTFRDAHKSSLSSAIYSGTVMHERRHPKKHCFSYPVFMIYADLDELDQLQACSRLCSAKWWAPLRFKREDFHGRSGSIKKAIYQTVHNDTGLRLDGPVRMLSNWRCFGFNFNPLVTYYCFDKRGENVVAIVAEVSNTPWLERHAYVLEVQSPLTQEDTTPCVNDALSNCSSANQFSFSKRFTVSPFNPLNMDYHWLSTAPGEKALISIHLDQQGERIFSASLTMTRHEFSVENLAKHIREFPMMSLQVVWRIYWQALKIFLKGVPFLGKNKESTVAKV